MLGWMRVWAPLFLTFAILSSASAQDLPREEGLALVTENCAGCHAIGLVDESPNPVSPKFRDLHLKYDVGDLEEALVEGIAAHPDMPEFAFAPEQAAAIIDYLRTLEEVPAESGAEAY